MTNWREFNSLIIRSLRIRIEIRLSVVDVFGKLTAVRTFSLCFIIILSERHIIKFWYLTIWPWLEASVSASTLWPHLTSLLLRRVTKSFFETTCISRTAAQRHRFSLPVRNFSSLVQFFRSRSVSIIMVVALQYFKYRYTGKVYSESVAFEKSYRYDNIVFHRSRTRFFGFIILNFLIPTTFEIE